jgi:hypothetical protein
MSNIVLPSRDWSRRIMPLTGEEDLLKQNPVNDTSPQEERIQTKLVADFTLSKVGYNNGLIQYLTSFNQKVTITRVIRFFQGSGSPQGNLIATIGDEYLNVVNGDFWKKVSGEETNIGWFLINNKSVSDIIDRYDVTGDEYITVEKNDGTTKKISTFELREWVLTLANEINERYRLKVGHFGNMVNGESVFWK